MRSLCSASTPCSAQCKYCFAKWDDIYQNQPTIATVKLNKDKTILYPCCDGELFDQQGIIDQIKNIADTVNNLYISVSTKRNLSVSEFNNILILNKWLTDNKKGFVKFSIAISTKTMIYDIEPGTMPYSERISLIKRLKQHNIRVSLTLKPVLPFVPLQEYLEVIEDFRPYIKCITIGGLYLNPTSAFYKEYIKDKYICTKRTVGWLNNHPQWYYIEDEEKIKQIESFSNKNHIQIFKSDEELIKSMIS